jgi:predicted transcriptional regulator
MRRLHTNGIPARTLDFLETDGGWLTVDGIAHSLGVRPESLSRALWRLHQRGLVEYRQVALAGDPSGRPTAYLSSLWSRVETRTEWRFVTWGDWS